MSRPRPQALDNLVFGLAILLFCVLGYYAFTRLRRPAVAERPRPAGTSLVEASNPPAEATLGISETEPVVSAVPAVASKEAPRSKRR